MSTGRVRRPYRTKPGKHGTLYLYAFPMHDGDPARPPETWRQWGYDLEHAWERLQDDAVLEGFDDWKLVGKPRRVRER